jgi:hypothetical protein
MQMFPTALSIAVSFLSAVTLLGTPSEIYLFGTMFGYQGKSNVEFIVNYNLFIVSYFGKYCFNRGCIGLYAEISRNELYKRLRSIFLFKRF